MAEVRKRKDESKYKIDESMYRNDLSKKKKTELTKKESKRKNSDKRKSSVSESRNSLWVRFRIFCHGVKSEFQKVHWPSKTDMIKYSVSTIFFVVFCSLFFYLIDILFAFVQSLLK